MRLRPWQLRITAGDDGPIIGRVWCMTEKDLVEYLRRAKGGEDVEGLVLELVANDAGRSEDTP